MKQRIIKLIIITLLSMIVNKASAIDATIDGIAYLLNANNEAIVVAGTSNYSGKVVIPESVTYEGKTYTITIIGDNAFAETTTHNLSSVVIPNTVKTIGKYVFWGHSGLTSVVIPPSVKSIGEGAFQCYNLKAVYISDLEAWANISFAGFDSNPLIYAKHLFLNGVEVKSLIILIRLQK